MEPFELDIQKSLQILKDGGLVLFPTDTGWIIGCDATNESAVAKLIAVKENTGQFETTVLMAEEREVLRWVAAPDLEVFDFVAQQTLPTTIVFENALGLPENLLTADGSVLIRLVRDTFCRHLIKRLRKPVAISQVSIPGDAAVEIFSQIPESILRSVDYAIDWRREETIALTAAQVVRWKGETRF